MELYTSWQYNEKHDADYANQQHKRTAKQIVQTKWDKNIIQQLLRAKQHIARSGEKFETKIIKKYGYFLRESNIFTTFAASLWY